MTCWNGASPSVFEQDLLKPYPTYALEQFRQRFLFTLTTTHDQVKSARVLLQMAFETEISAILVKMISLPASVPESNVCERRHFNDIDADMSRQGFLILPALDDLAKVPNIPAPYVDFLRLYVASNYPRYRMCALAAALCLATFLQNT